MKTKIGSPGEDAVESGVGLLADMKLGICEHCGDEGQLFADNNRCEECDNRFYPCSICKEEQFDEDACRHRG